MVEPSLVLQGSIFLVYGCLWDRTLPGVSSNIGSQTTKRESYNSKLRYNSFMYELEVFNISCYYYCN